MLYVSIVDCLSVVFCNCFALPSFQASNEKHCRVGFMFVILGINGNEYKSVDYKTAAVTDIKYKMLNKEHRKCHGLTPLSGVCCDTGPGDACSFQFVRLCVSRV